METAYAKYRPDEVFQIFYANYRQQQQFDDVVVKGVEFRFDTTIFDWRDSCDLVETSELWKYLNYYFHLSIDRQIWMSVLEPENEKNLGDLCNFISLHADKEIIRPIRSLGSNCELAGIFKSLMSRLRERGIDVSDIRPSSELEPLVRKYSSVVIEEINRLDPEVLPLIDYKANWVYKLGLQAFLIFLAITIFFIYKQSIWAWTIGGISFAGYIMTWIGAKLTPKKAGFAGIHTISDLVRRIHF
jgi:hypothetical protein